MNDNDTPFRQLDTDSLLGIRRWVWDAIVAHGGRVTGAGIGIKGSMGMADIGFEVDGFKFNVEITPLDN